MTNKEATLAGLYVGLVLTFVILMAILIRVAISQGSEAPDTLILAGPIDVAGTRDRLAWADAMPGHNPSLFAFRHIADVGGSWYSAAWLCERAGANWGRDTVEAESQGRTLRALEQFATTPLDLRIVPLVGMVSTGDLNRRNFHRQGRGIIVWLRFREPLDEAVVLRRQPPLSHLPQRGVSP